jgi:transcriptional regulator with XRE-family HTH domain
VTARQHEGGAVTASAGTRPRRVHAGHGVTLSAGAVTVVIELVGGSGMSGKGRPGAAGRVGRMCACGTPLSVSNPGIRCGPCERDRVTNDGPPVLPFDFWTTERFRAPFASRNIGYVLRAYRTDPYHRETYPNGIPQSRVARWLGIDQAAVSDLELGRRGFDSISKTIDIAQKIGVPPQLLWIKPATVHELAESDTDRIGLAILREGAGLTQDSFARKVGVNRSTVKRWETGEAAPPLHQRYAIAKILGVPQRRLAEALTHAEQNHPTSSAAEGADMRTEAKTEQPAEPVENDVENDSEPPKQYNELFRVARESTPSETNPGLCISRAELAEAVNHYLSQTTGKVHTALDARHIGRIERGQIRWPSKTYRTPATAQKPLK